MTGRVKTRLRAGAALAVAGSLLLAGTGCGSSGDSQESGGMLAAAERRTAERSPPTPAAATRAAGMRGMTSGPEPARLDAADPQAREEAIYELAPSGDDLATLLGVLAREPDARVRQAAVIRLADAEDPAAARGLADALADPDRQVVLEAIDALELVGDADAVWQLGALESHPDPEVREAARDAVEYLLD